MERSRWYIVLLVTLTLFITGFCEAKEKGTIRLIVVGLRNSNGNVRIALNNSDKTFRQRRKKGLEYSDTTVRSVIVKVENKRVEYIFSDIPFGDYAIKLFHDENGNENLDTSFLGLPKEDYGFSNNVRGFFGIPSFERAKFRLEAPEKIIEISVH